MKRTSLIRLGGLAAMVGGVAYTALGLLVPFLEPIFFVLLAIAAMVAIAALHALQRERYGLPGTVASLTVFIGVVLILGSNLGFTEGLPWPLPERIFLVGVVVAALGMVALGIATIAARVLPWWCGVALMVGGIGFVGPMLALSWTGFFMGLLAGAAWALVGYAIFRAGTRQTRQASRVR
jgi:drug/metabolite transporter (DMT)-like permease